ncbi:MAG: hypothetical protein MK132_03945 [Lentisphaerales bacterium]|nr:hypothetical protein [Lentisphaerales bacterium]
MSRTYFVLALANMALLDNSLLYETCSIIDDIIHNTLETEKNRGFKYFLLEYGKGGGWVNYPEGSIFVDGEIALMIGARRALQEKEEYKKLQYNRINKIKSRMRQSSILCDESYPNECWLFCNTVALAAIKISDKLDGTDHSKFFASWIQSAKDNLIDKQTGLLISAFTVNARPLPTGPGPEGSSIWMASHMLQIIDEDFANDQYKRAKQELAGQLFGFAYAREFPKGFDGEADVDSGPIIPIIEASASSSGLAILGAAAFNDSQYLQDLLTSVNFAGFPEDKDGKRRYLASNPVGDAVLLYALMEGPLWQMMK